MELGVWAINVNSTLPKSEEAPVLEIRELWGTASLLLVPGPFSPEQVEPLKNNYTKNVTMNVQWTQFFNL